MSKPIRFFGILGFKENPSSFTNDWNTFAAQPGYDASRWDIGGNTDTGTPWWQWDDDSLAPAIKAFAAANPVQEIVIGGQSFGGDAARKRAMQSGVPNLRVAMWDPVSNEHNGVYWPNAGFPMSDNVLEALCLWRNPANTEQYWSCPIISGKLYQNIVIPGSHVESQWRNQLTYAALLRVQNGGNLIDRSLPFVGAIPTSTPVNTSTGGQMSALANWTVVNGQAANNGVVDQSTHGVVNVFEVNGVWYQLNTAGRVWTLTGTGNDQDVTATVKPPVNTPVKVHQFDVYSDGSVKQVM